MPPPPLPPSPAPFYPPIRWCSRGSVGGVLSGQTSARSGVLKVQHRGARVVLAGQAVTVLAGVLHPAAMPRALITGVCSGGASEPLGGAGGRAGAGGHVASTA